MFNLYCKACNAKNAGQRPETTCDVCGRPIEGADNADAQLTIGNSVSNSTHLDICRPCVLKLLGDAAELINSGTRT